jgi:hypothetical protein
MINSGNRDVACQFLWQIAGRDCYCGQHQHSLCFIILLFQFLVFIWTDAYFINTGGASIKFKVDTVEL